MALSQKTHVFKWVGKAGAKWIKLHDVRLELPEDTLLEVEFVHELRGEVCMFPAEI